MARAKFKNSDDKHKAKKKKKKQIKRRSETITFLDSVKVKNNTRYALEN